MLSGRQIEDLWNSHIDVGLDDHSAETKHLLEEYRSSWVEVSWIHTNADGPIETSCVWTGEIVHCCDFEVVPVVEEDEMNIDSVCETSLGEDEVEVDVTSRGVEGGWPIAEGEAPTTGFDATEEGNQDPLSGRKAELKNICPGDCFCDCIEVCYISLDTHAEVEGEEVWTPTDDVAAPDKTPSRQEVILDFDNKWGWGLLIKREAKVEINPSSGHELRKVVDGCLKRTVLRAILGLLMGVARVTGY